MRWFAAAVVFAWGLSTASAQVVVAAGNGVVVAHDGVMELYEGSRQVWSTTGVAAPAFAAIGEETVVVVDSFHNSARTASLKSGRGTTLATNETPVDALFLGKDLYLLERDAATLTRHREGESPVSLDIAAGPLFLRQSRGALYVYSHLEGVLQEIDVRSFRIVRRLVVPAAASDMEVSGNSAYLLYPRAATVVAVNLVKWAIETTSQAGGVPVDLAIVRSGNALSATRIAIADPAAKRLWITEGAQSVGGAFGRGFLRGLIGLGLFRPSSSDFPTGIDRVHAAEDVVLAYDTTRRTLYRVRGSAVNRVAEGIAPQSFSVARGRIVLWRDGALRWLD